MTIEDRDALKETTGATQTQAEALQGTETPAEVLPQEDAVSEGSAPVWELENRAPTLKEWADSLDEKKFKLYQIIGGVVTGIAAACCLMLIPETETFSSLNFLFAVAIALLIPRLLEKRFERRLGALRFAAAGALLVGLLVSLLNVLVFNPM